jgi:hypothetical protein
MAIFALGGAFICTAQVVSGNAEADWVYSPQLLFGWIL